MMTSASSGSKLGSERRWMHALERVRFDAGFVQNDERSWKRKSERHRLIEDSSF